jgi:hypothetical protein
MELLGDVGHVESHFFLFIDSGTVGARSVHGCVGRTIGSELFWTHPMELLGDVGHVESCFFPFADSVRVDAR